MQKNKFKLLELFSGYGSQALALENLGIDFESKISEIDKYAINTYNQIHGDTFNYGDISQIDSVDYADLWTYSFPCQDLSIAGKQEGIKEGTRSGLLLEVERLLTNAVANNNQPKYLLLENVKALVCKKFKPDFDRWLNKLDELGYKNYWQVLNAKDYGIPQNRERVFVVSIRKDIKKQYEFPKKEELKLRLKDILEDNVDEKYYLKKQIVDFYIKNTEEQKAKGNGFKFTPSQGDCVAKAITTRAGGRMDDNYIEEPLAYDEQNQYLRKDGCVGVKEIYENSYRIRKLTPRECWRLMGVKDEVFNKIEGISNAQLYKMAGNSIVVKVLEKIFYNLFNEPEYSGEHQLELF